MDYEEEKKGGVSSTHTPIDNMHDETGRCCLLDQAGTKRNIKSRHAQMLAIGGVIGTGLFVGSGEALTIGGPAFLLIAYCIITLLVYGVITAVVEVATFLPVSGSSMAYYCTRFVSPSLGFALGWLYFYTFGISAAYEITAASIVIDYWPSSVHPAVWIAVMLVVIVALNLAPVGVYAEIEFWFAGIKVIMIVGLLLLSLILMCGGGPSGQVSGFHYWNHPSAFKPYLLPGSAGYFTSFLYIWIFSGFAFYFGPELLVFTAGEMRNPRKNLPIAAKHFFWRLVTFYILGALAIGIICNSNSPGLVSGDSDAKASPFVIAIHNAGIPILGSIVNAGVLISAWSSGNSCLYMSSRALYSLALSGAAPKIFTKCTSYGLPIYAVGTSSLFSLLAFLTVGDQAGVVFNWFISLTNTAGFTSWIVCCIILIRFRKACNAQGVEVPYRSRFQPYASWISMGFFVFLLLMNGFTVFYPGNFTVSGFLVTYLGIPIFLVLFLGHKAWAGRRDEWLVEPGRADLLTGVREVEADQRMWMVRDEAREGERGGGTSVRRAWKKLAILWE